MLAGHNIEDCSEFDKLTYRAQEDAVRRVSRIFFNPTPLKNFKRNGVLIFESKRKAAFTHALPTLILHSQPFCFCSMLLPLPRLLILALPLRAQGSICVSEPLWVGEIGFRRRSRLLLFDHEPIFL